MGNQSGYWFGQALANVLLLMPVIALAALLVVVLVCAPFYVVRWITRQGGKE